MSRTETKHSPDLEGRRLLAKALAIAPPVIAGVALGLGVPKVLEWWADFTYTGEGNENNVLAGKPLEGGEILDVQSLARLYLEAITKNWPIEPDPTIIRSTLYQAMRFFRLAKGLALKRSQNITISTSEESLCVGAACVYDSSSSLGVELTEKLFTEQGNPQTWLRLLHLSAHEGYHLAVDRVDDRKGVEGYGPLGKYEMVKDKRGFKRDENHLGPVDLIRRFFAGSLGESFWINLPEEFFAEVGRMRFVNYLETLGLNISSVINEYSHTSFPFMAQALVNTQDTKGVRGLDSWQKFWGDSLKPERVDYLHRTNNRLAFYEGVGRALLSKNPHRRSHSLSPEALAGLGVVAFADFADHGLSNYQVLTDLIRQPITEDLIITKARQLHLRANS